MTTTRKLTAHEEKLLYQVVVPIEDAMELIQEISGDGDYGELGGLHVELLNAIDDGLELGTPQERDFVTGLITMAEAAIEIITSHLSNLPTGQNSELKRELVRQQERLRKFLKSFQE